MRLLPQGARRSTSVSLFAWLIALTVVLSTTLSRTADHNDPNAINSIFSDISPNAADLYDLFGFPSDDEQGGQKVVVALTFASVPRAGVLDSDMLYRLLFAPNPRVAPPMPENASVEALLAYFDAVKDKYLRLKAAEVRVRVDPRNRAHIDFYDFPGGAISAEIDTNKPATVKSPGGAEIKVFVGGRDDAFFNDLPGFFRSINYAPQFYRVPRTMTDTRELPIPKTLLELDGNTLFNFDPANPQHGQGVKMELPKTPLTWSGNAYKKDAQGNYRFVYSGRDAQAGRNVNAIILEIPLTYLTRAPQTDRIVNVWGESWVSKASHKIAAIPDEGAYSPLRSWLERYGALLAIFFLLVAAWLVYRMRGRAWSTRHIVSVAVAVLLAAIGLWLAFRSPALAPGQQGELARASEADELRYYKLVDTDGQPFADAGLSEREDNRQVGANNFWLGPHFVQRLAHLGWGFGPSISALGLKTAFDHGNSPISIHRTYSSPIEAFPRVKKVLFQSLNMPDGSWDKKNLHLPLRRAFEVFIPNVCAIDMDTTGTWPFGRRLEDQVATRFLSLFLDMSAQANGKPYNLDSLNDPAVLASLPMEPKVPPNPLHNDKPFLAQFPYLAEPW
jgi:hypothetical protein